MKDENVVGLVTDDAILEKLASDFGALPVLLEQMESAQVKTDDEAIEYLEEEMVKHSSIARELILRQPPKTLIGYLWSTRYMTIVSEMDEQGSAYRPNKLMSDEMQFVLEYIHATWSSVGVPDDQRSFEEADIALLFNSLATMRNAAMLYCVIQSGVIAMEGKDVRLGETAMRAFTSWMHERGRRYQVLEEEFFRLALRPHSSELQRVYGMSADAIAANLQRFVHTTRTGIAEAISRIQLGMAIDRRNHTPKSKHRGFATDISNAYDDFLNGGICNLSRHSQLTKPILEDLCFTPGEEKSFLDEGPLRGTPFRTLPARVKPGIKLGEEFYVTDGQFIRDVAYRTIQRGLRARSPNYKEKWNIRQKRMSEEAFLKIFRSQLANTTAYRAVYYPLEGSNNWAETDLVIVVDDVLIVVEAKAGVMSMESPVADFDKHMQSVDRLMVRAYQQCERFLEYLRQSGNAPIYVLKEGRHVEISRLCLADFRKVFPIGLTLENLSPFSTGLNNLDQINPAPVKHSFMSMSIEDLLVLKRFLPTVGELLHFFDVRQRAGVLNRTALLDEMEFLGAYISLNRFDQELKAQSKKASFVLWSKFADEIDKYFEGENAGIGPIPRQTFPPALKTMLQVLDQRRPVKWLRTDSFVRDLKEEKRAELGKGIALLMDSLDQAKRHWKCFANGQAILLCVSRKGLEPSTTHTRCWAEVACIALRIKNVQVLCLSYNKSNQLSIVSGQRYDTPDQNKAGYDQLVSKALVLGRPFVNGRAIRDNS